MTIKFWMCPSCGNSYLHKPPQCVLTGVFLARQGVLSGCGESGDWPLQEREVQGIVAFEKGWDTFDGPLIDLTLSDGTTKRLTFHGDLAAFDRLEEFLGFLVNLSGPTVVL